MSAKNINIKDIDQHIRDAVFGYIKLNVTHQNISNDVQVIILMYYWQKLLVYVSDQNHKGQLGCQPQIHKYQIEHIYNGNQYSIYASYNNKNYFSTGGNDHATKITSFINKNIKIKHIFTNIIAKHTFWMDINDNIYAIGLNNRHQFGLKDDKNNNEGIQIKYLKNIKDIQCSYSYTLALDHNNNVYSTGYGQYGELGHGINKLSIKQFTAIKELNNCNIIKIKTGFNHSLFLSSNYSLYCCGANYSGQLGLGHRNNEYIPVINNYFNKNNIKIIDIECGSDHNLCIGINNNIYSFGDNRNGQCGLGLNDLAILIPLQINVLKNEKIISIKCGSSHSYCLSSSNNHYLWGWNGNNQCIIDKNEMIEIQSPYLMNKIIKIAVNNKQIKEIFLGNCCTQIIVIE